MSETKLGPGDEATWPECDGDPMDPRATSSDSEMIERWVSHKTISALIDYETLHDFLDDDFWFAHGYIICR